MKILVIQKKRIGDVLTSTVIFEALKQKYPQSELHYLIYENAIPVVLNNPFIDKIIILNEATRKGKRNFLRFLFQIRNEKYNAIIDAYGKPNSVLIGWFSGAKIKVTFDKLYARLFYSHSMIRNDASFSNATKAIEHRLLLLQPLGIDFSEISPKIFLTPQEIKEAKSRLKDAGLNVDKAIVMISALGSGPEKTYPLLFLAEVLNQIAAYDVQILLNYLPFQKPEIHQLLGFCSEQTKVKIFSDFYESDLRKFLAITNQCAALIGNEGGATNMSKALNVPTFSIYSPFVKKLDWSYFENQTTIVSVHVDDFLNDHETAMPVKVLNKPTYQEVYARFKPQLFQAILTDFLNFNLQK